MIEKDDVIERRVVLALTFGALSMFVAGCGNVPEQNEVCTEILFYPDADGDGFGLETGAESACEPPTALYVPDSGDCDDTNPNAHPGGAEVCDGADNDCDGTSDNPEIVLGDEAACAAESCAAVQTARSDAQSGEYFLTVDVFGPVPLHCDFDSPDGPFTFIVSPDLEAYWSFDGEDLSASTIGDFTGSTLGATQPSTRTPGSQFGNSVQFTNDESSRIDMTTPVAFTVTSTVSFWTFHDSCSNNQIPIMMTTPDTFMGDLLFRARLRVSEADAFLTSENTCQEDIFTWFHHAYVDDGTEIRVYIDGIAAQPDVYEYRSLMGFAIGHIGSRPDFGTNGLSGHLDDLAVFDRVLSEDEIQRIHALGRVTGLPLRSQ